MLKILTASVFALAVLGSQYIVPVLTGTTQPAGGSSDPEISVDCTVTTCYYIREGGSASTTGTGACVSTGSGNWNTANACNVFPATMVRGATYLVADGSYGNKNFSQAVSGTTLITVQKATETYHGTNTGWAAAYGDGQAVFLNLDVTSNYWMINGQHRTDWYSGYGFKSGLSGGNPQTDLTGSNVTIKYLEIQGEGIDVGCGTGCIDRGIQSNNGADNVTLSRIYIHDAWVPIFTDNNTNGWTLEYSVIARNSNSGAFHSEAWAASGDDDVTIRYNRFEDIKGTGLLIDLTRGGTGLADNWKVYGNTFIMSEGNPYGITGVGDGVLAVINDQTASNWYFYNNSIINYSVGVSSRVEIDNPGGASATNLNVRNNLWWNSLDAAHSVSACTGCTVSHNRYDNTPSTAGESNRENNASALQSLFVSYLTKDFRLASATTAGVTLASPYDVDANGVTRGADGVWDRGAFEYAGPIPEPLTFIMLHWFQDLKYHLEF